MGHELPYISITPKWGSNGCGSSEELKIHVSDILGMSSDYDDEGNERWSISVSKREEDGTEAIAKIRVKETPEDILKKISELQGQVKA